MIKLSVLLAMVCLTGCDPQPGVRVVRDGAGYVVEVTNCSSRARPMGVQDIVVRKVGAGQAPGNTCELTAKVAGDLLERWRYGEEVAQFQLGKCSLLERGATYMVDVVTHPGEALGHFTIDAHGDVKMIDGQCR
jgi:hypothetical protein